jgi:hypothetical protein
VVVTVRPTSLKNKRCNNAVDYLNNKSKEGKIMAWDDFIHENVQCFTGDKPLDEFSSAIKNICIEYEERFGRQPRIIELVTALESVLNTYKEDYIFDLRENDDISISYSISKINPAATEPPPRKINLEAIYDFEGAYYQDDEIEFPLVERKSNLTFDAKSEDCIKMPTLEVIGNSLICEYEILVDDMDDLDAYKIIYKYYLGKFSGNYYKEKASIIQFSNIISGLSSSFDMQTGISS